MIRAACYARYSSDLQRETSIQDQLAAAARFARDHGWTVVSNQIYADAAVSGASIQGRSGLQRLMAAAAQRPRPFDVLLVDDSSRVARDIPDAIRVMQQLKFLGIRVIYISQGIDSDSEQADALVAVHGLIDSMYLKELAKKVRRGLAGQMDRGFSTGARQYGYDKVPVFDPSGRTDPDGRPLVIGRRIQVNPEEAKAINRIFEWAADGVGVATIVDRLNREGVAGTGGGRWNQTPVKRVLNNERYLGRQIYGQQAVEREPATGRRIMRDRPRSEWKVIERPEMRIVSDDLWHRVQATRKAVREAVAPKGGLARGKFGPHHSKQLFSGFAKCGECGGTISIVSGGKGSPRFGCARSWRNGTSSCSNRLTIRVKVAEPQILEKLQQTLLESKTLAFIVKALDREQKKARSVVRNRDDDPVKLVDQNRRRLQNLVAALEGGTSAPAAIVRAIAEKEKVIEQLERAVRSRAAPALESVKVADLSAWVKQQLEDLTGLLKSDVARVKSEFRRLNLALTFAPTDAAPRPHYVVKGQCDMSALAFSFVRPTDDPHARHRCTAAPKQRLPILLPGALVGLMGANRVPARNWWRGRSTN